MPATVFASPFARTRLPTVLGGGIGQAEGFLDAVEREVRRHAPIPPELRVSALGADAVVDGCLAAGIDRAWGVLTATVAPASAEMSGETAAGLR